ncbi:MAG: hypothetical protein HYZ00_00160, partial [Candidatus Hydrogenedentes bacterium]|nr:hypothetical protein [Candidatus Hydrogenedentota bacterium]
MVWTVLLSAILCCAAGAGAQEEGWTFVQGDWTLRISGKGQVESLKNGAGVELVQGAPAVYVTMALPESGGGEEKKAEKGKTYLSTLENGIEITREMTPGWPLVMNERTEFVSIAGWPVLRRTITVVPTAPPFVEAFSVAAAQRLRPGEAGAVFVPRQDGLGEIVPGEPGRAWVWGLTGLPEKVEPEQRLALPLLSEVSGDGAVRLTTLVDPGASAYFMLRPAGGSPEWVVNTESGAQPLNEPLTRTLWTVIQSGGPEEALKAWYAVALADVPPGPDWLHDIAWQHYDYMSHGGQGWFEDLDAVEKMVAPEDRGKIIFALHGWYDLLGRYTFDAAAGKLDDTWTAFPNAAAMKEKGFPTSEPVAMSQAELHRRIKYAKDKGVRVALYFADGLTACEGAGRFAEDRVLFWGGWNGPDTQGRAYCQNPVHPEVYQWYVEYLEALLAGYGQEIDALVWDETFIVRAGTLTP